MREFQFVQSGLALSFLLIFSPQLMAVMPTNPVSDREFLRLPDGRDLDSIKVGGTRLSLVKGSGKTWGSTARTAYENLKTATLNDPLHFVQWTFMDLDAHRVVAQSLGARRRLFGASVSKIFVSGALLDKQRGVLSSAQLQLMANMLVVSSNTAWTELQSQIGDGSSNRGREGVHTFTQRMGYRDTFGFQGTWGNMHGNELTAADLAEYMHDTYKGNYLGAETLWKLMHTCRTGGQRGRKYIPSDIFVGAKTGTYSGQTQIDGQAVNVRVRNHLLIFNIGGRQYALAVLADSGSDESAALLAGGLIREHSQL